MVDALTIGGAISGLKTAAEIAKSMIGLRDAALIQGKVIELQSAILAAQSSALAAQSEQSSLLERIRGLEKQIADLEAWEAEKQRYKLTELNRGLSSGAFAYVIKHDAQGAEPPHAICAECYQHGKKSILRWSQSGMTGTVTFRCLQCKTEFDAWSNDDFALEPAT